MLVQMDAIPADVLVSETVGHPPHSFLQAESFNHLHHRFMVPMVLPGQDVHELDGSVWEGQFDLMDGIREEFDEFSWIIVGSEVIPPEEEGHRFHLRSRIKSRPLDFRDEALKGEPSLPMNVDSSPSVQSLRLNPSSLRAGDDNVAISREGEHGGGNFPICLLSLGRQRRDGASECQKGRV